MSEQGLPHTHAGILLTGSDDEWRVGLQRAVDHPDAVAEPGSYMQVDDPRLAARLGIEARGADRHSFVQGNVVAQLRVIDETVEQRVLGGTGVAEDAVRAVCDEPLHEYLTTAHCRLPS